MLNRSLSYGKSEEYDLFTAKQNIFAKAISTHGKGHQEKEKSNCNNTKEAQCSSKREHKQISSHESEIE